MEFEKVLGPGADRIESWGKDCRTKKGPSSQEKVQDALGSSGLLRKQGNPSKSSIPSTESTEFGFFIPLHL